MADTRKDKRAPISIKVRFKSATLDEFIEQYSLDISRGGIFIKAPKPMAVGTLLKFEFRLKDDSRLIHGVGRVVWNRDEDSSSGKPPGMGIKFIKMDPESRALVEQMVARRGDAPGRFEEGQTDDAPASSGGGSFFPSTTPASQLPAPEDRTQVRHASEFLASALAEGGSESASKEAEKKAAEARRRTEEIEKQRAEQAKRRTPRLKKTLAGVGVPEAAAEAPALEAQPVALASSGLDDGIAGLQDEPDSEHERTVAVDRRQLESLARESKKTDGEASAAEPTRPVPKPPFEATPVDDDEEELAAPAPVRVEPPKIDPPKVVPKPVEERRPAVASTPDPAPASDAPKSRAGMIFFGVIAAAAIGLIIWFQVQPPAEHARGVGEQNAIATQPAVPDEPADEGTAIEEEQAGDEQPDVAEEEPEAAPATTAVNVVTTPPGATVLVDGEERGTSPVAVQLPVGRPATVTARLTGYATATQEVTAAAEGQAPIELALTQLEYVIHVETTPPGARVRGSVGQVTAPGDLVLRRPPTEPITLMASMRGHDNSTVQVDPTAFTESDGRMVASVTLALTERAEPARGERASGTSRGSGGTSERAGRQADSAGSGETGGGEETGGRESGGARERDSEPSGGGGTGGGGGGASDTPDNPFG